MSQELENLVSKLEDKNLVTQNFARAQRWLNREVKEELFSISVCWSVGGELLFIIEFQGVISK